MEMKTSCEEMARRVKEAPSVKALKKLIESGTWHPSHRRSNTGIGKTLEDLLGIKENNNKKGDIEVPGMDPVELKTSREDSKSMITLFTKSPEPRSIGNRQLLGRFGYFQEDSKTKELHWTLKVGENDIKGKKLLLEVSRLGEENRIDLIDAEAPEKTIVAYYSRKAIEKAVMSKLSSGLVLVEAESKKLSGDEYFKYTRATYLCGLKVDAIFDLIVDGSLLLDLRLGTYKSGKSKGKPHDHGNGFRTFEKNLKDIFSYMIEL
ncbi:MAG: hypothetical protein GXX80_09170 [Thermotogaceae bacterium]|nr:hypothetical protein [Thermotogaceae bacterium]